MFLQNNLFEYNDWSVANMGEKTGGLGTVISSGPNHKFIRNTMRFNGASNGYRPLGENPLGKLNHIHDQCSGVLEHDGGSIPFQFGAQTNAKADFIPAKAGFIPAQSTVSALMGSPHDESSRRAP